MWQLNDFSCPVGKRYGYRLSEQLDCSDGGCGFKEVMIEISSS